MPIYNDMTMNAVSANPTVPTATPIPTQSQSPMATSSPAPTGTPASTSASSSASASSLVSASAGGSASGAGVPAEQAANGYAATTTAAWHNATPAPDLAVTPQKIHESFESAALRSLPLSSLEKIFIERGGLDLDTLKALDNFLSGKSAAIDPSSPAQVERLEQWLRLALDNPKMAEDLAERLPIMGAREIADKLKVLSNVGISMLDGGKLQQISPEKFFLGADIGASLKANAARGDLLRELVSKIFSDAPAKLLDLINMIKTSGSDGGVKLLQEEARKVIGDILNKMPSQISGKPELLHDAKMLSPKITEWMASSASNAAKTAAPITRDVIAPPPVNTRSPHAAPMSRNTLINDNIPPSRNVSANDNTLSSRNVSINDNSLSSRNTLTNDNIPSSRNVSANDNTPLSRNTLINDNISPSRNVSANDNTLSSRNISMNDNTPPSRNTLINDNMPSSRNVSANDNTLPSRNIPMNNNTPPSRSVSTNDNLSPSRNTLTNNNISLSRNSLLADNPAVSRNAPSVTAAPPLRDEFDRTVIPRAVYDRVTSERGFTVGETGRNAVLSQAGAVAESVRRAISDTAAPPRAAANGSANSSRAVPAAPDDARLDRAQMLRRILTQTDTVKTEFQRAYSSIDVKNLAAPSDFSGGFAPDAIRRGLDTLRSELLLGATLALQDVFSSADGLGRMVEAFASDSSSRVFTDAEKALLRAAEALVRAARQGGAEIAEKLSDLLRELNRAQTEAMRSDGRSLTARTPAEIMRSAALTAASGLENLQMLAAQTRAGENIQQQMFALPVKMGQEWTEVQIKFIKKDGKKSGKGEGKGDGHVSVYLNVTPSALGHVSAHLDFHPPTNLKLSFQFEKPEVTKWFKERAGALRVALTDAGLPGTSLEFHSKPAARKRAVSAEHVDTHNVTTGVRNKDGNLDLKV